MNNIDASIKCYLTIIIKKTKMGQLATTNYWSDDKFIASAAFFTSFVWIRCEREEELADQTPLVVTLARSWSGLCASVLAVFVSKLLPENARCLLTFSLFGAFLYYEYKSAKKKDSPKVKQSVSVAN